MSLSEDEDDFLSADEDGFGDESKVEKKIQENEPTRVAKKPEIAPQKTTPVIDSAKLTSDLGNITTSTEEDVDKSKNDPIVCSEVNSTIQDEDIEDEEEALAKRIRERNIKIARKFSQEIAKNVKASAPIAVRSNKAIDAFKTLETDSTTNPDSDIKSSPPPAPPPTPALSSSFNSDETIGVSSSSGTQYGWRVPSKISQPSQADDSPADVKIEQTRLALDRLSASLSQADNKNLLEKVAEDIKRVSLKPKDAPAADNQETNSGGIPIISDLSSTLGGWSWGGASKLLASASHVTSLASQVGSVLVPAVNNSVDDSDKTTSLRSASQHSDSEDHNPPTLSSGSGANSKDGLMDFTLNTMESLGKRAFGVMTERNESGSLQIKGIGRPWEHLMNVQRTFDEDADSKPTVAPQSVTSSKKND